MLLRRFETYPGALTRDWGREIDRVFDSLFAAERATGVENRGPLLNLWEEEDALRLEAEVPGFALDQLEVSVLDRKLTLKGNTEAIENEGDGQRTHLRERSSESFTRTLTLPFRIDAGEVRAELKDGILRILLPKAESDKPKRIDVESK